MMGVVVVVVAVTVVAVHTVRAGRKFRGSKAGEAGREDTCVRAAHVRAALRGAVARRRPGT